MSDRTKGLLPTNVALLQPAAQFFRLDQALQALNLTGNIATLQAQVAQQATEITTLQGQVTTLQGQVSTLQTQVQNLILFQNSFNWVQAEVSTGLTFLDSRTIYTRSFVISGAVNVANNMFTYAHGIAAINYIAQCTAMVAINSGPSFPVTYFNSTVNPIPPDGISISVDATNIYVYNGNIVRTNYLTLVKLYYTATNR